MKCLNFPNQVGIFSFKSSQTALDLQLELDLVILQDVNRVGIILVMTGLCQSNRAKSVPTDLRASSIFNKKSILNSHCSTTVTHITIESIYIDCCKKNYKTIGKILSTLYRILLVEEREKNKLFCPEISFRSIVQAWPNLRLDDWQSFFHFA